MNFWEVSYINADLKVGWRAIEIQFIYRPACNFKIIEIYSLHVKALAKYKGKKEIVLLGLEHCLLKKDKYWILCE